MSHYLKDVKRITLKADKRYLCTDNRDCGGIFTDSTAMNLLINQTCTFVVPSSGRRKEEEGNVLFNDALNTFYLRLYGVRHMVKDHSDSEKGNPLPSHRQFFTISSKGSFICIIPQTG